MELLLALGALAGAVAASLLGLALFVFLFALKVVFMLFWLGLRMFVKFLGFLIGVGVAALLLGA